MPPTPRAAGSSRYPARTSTSSSANPIDLAELRSKPVDARSIRDASLLIMSVVRDMVADIRGEDTTDGVLRPEKGRAAGKARPTRTQAAARAGPTARAADSSPARRRAAGSPAARMGRALDPGRGPIERVAVLGAGSWGTTYAKVLADAGRTVTLWARRESVAASGPRRARQPRLPARHRLPETSTRPRISTRRWTAWTPWCSAVPSQALRENLRVFRDSLPPTVPIVSLAKGVEIGTGLRMSEVIERVGPGRPGADRRAHRAEPGRGDRARAGRPRRCWPAPTTSGRWRFRSPAPPRISGRTRSPT